MIDGSNQDMQAPGSKEPIRRVVDSTVAIAFARLFMPIALAIIGYFMVQTVSDIKTEIREANAAVWTAVKEVASTVNKQNADIATLKTANEYTSKTVDRLTTAVDQLTRKPN
jgi:hypothetical protein